LMKGGFIFLKVERGLDSLSISPVGKHLSTYHRLSAGKINSRFKVGSVFVFHGDGTFTSIKSFEMSVDAVLDISFLTACQMKRQSEKSQLSRHSEYPFLRAEVSFDAVKKRPPKLSFRYPDLFDFRPHLVPSVIGNIVELNQCSRCHSEQPRAFQLFLRQSLSGS